MKKFFPGAHLKLPGKRLFGNFEPLFIKHRKDGLIDFIKYIMDSPDMYSQLVNMVIFNRKYYMMMIYQLYIYYV